MKSLLFLNDYYIILGVKEVTILNPQECTIEFKKYLKKLLLVIEHEASFTFISTKIIDKKRIDDVMCCVEASWPEDYKKYIAKFDTKKIKSPLYYRQMILAIKNKFFFSTSCYSVNYKEATQAITSLMVAIENDMRFIYSDQSGMF